MQDLGFTRSANCADHLLQTPDTFVRIPLPGIVQGTAIVHIAPAKGAKFRQYTVELQPAGVIEPTRWQRFVYVLEGEVCAGHVHLAPGGFAYFPAGSKEVVISKGASRLAVIEKPYDALPQVAPHPFFTGNEADIPAEPLGGDDALLVRCMLPTLPSLDFAVNTMTYLPGASLPMVEIHVMEHGLLMLEGGGIYRLGDRWYPAIAGDFIWMAPYCPQWFGAIGKAPAKYLIYKDWNRWS